MFTKKPQSNFFTSILPLYVFLKIITILLPSSTGKFRDGILHVKTIDKIWFLVVYCGLIYLEYLNISTEHAIVAYSLLLARAWECCVVVGLFVVLLTLPYYYFKSDKIAKILTSFKDFDEKVRKQI